MTAPELILASTSSWRRMLLERLRVPFRCVTPDVDETALSAGLHEPELIARTLAKAKALAVARSCPEAIVIGSDQVCALDERVFGKPGDAEGAVKQLLALQGREHRLITAVAVAHRGQVERFTEVAALHMRALDEGEVQRYVAAERPLDCAGSYRIESLGIALFESIHCHDHTAIVGLPLLRLCAVLRGFGVAVP
jgi:septum formation protein